MLDGFYIVHTFDLERASLPTRSLSSLMGEEESKGFSFNDQNEEVERSDETTRSSSSEDPAKNEAIFEAFKHPSMYSIEALFFLSDSTLLMLLSGQEIRILDTQAFIPQQYDAELIYEGKVTIKR